MTWQSRKAVGALLNPYMRIGGHKTFAPPLLAHVQTGGFFDIRHGAHVAAIVLSANRKQWQDMTWIKAKSLTEADWASILFGVTIAVNKGQEAIGIEHHNLSVIHGLIFPKNRLQHEYATYYRNEIQKVTAVTRWTGVRWIPHELNRSNDLFHLR
jgi:hypothetical protein